MNFNKMKNFFRPAGISGIILALFIITACDLNGVESDLSTPAVVSTDPADDAVNIAVNSSISVTFSEAMNPLTINSTNLKLLKGGAEICTEISYDAVSCTAVINPASELEFSNVYTVKVYAGAADMSGNTMASAFTSAFETAVNAVPPEPDDDNTVIKLVFVGDINLGTKVGESVVSNGGGDYNFPFAPVASYIQSFDLAFGNLESIISDRGTTTKPYMGVDLRADPDSVNGLAGAGFDVVSVANNHAGDFGEDGMVDSFNRLTAAGIGFAGGGLNYDAARKPVIRDVKGTKVACLSYTNIPMYMDSYYAGQIPTSRWIATDSRPGIAWAHDTRFENYGDISDMTADIRAARAIADVVVVMMHFGWEYKYQPDQAQQDLAHAAIDAGAALVIGHHPHVCQKIEQYNGGFIAYSLGNFVFDISEAMAEGATRGMAVEATFTDGKLTNVHTRSTSINEYYQVSLIEE